MDRFRSLFQPHRQPSSSGSSDLYHQGHDHQTHRDDKKEEPLTYTAEGDAQIILSGGQSPGVRRMEAINAHLKTWERWALFFGVFLVTYVYGLDGTGEPLVARSFLNLSCCPDPPVLIMSLR
jgi:hypothetical protein